MKIIADVNSVEKSYGLTQVINHCNFKIYGRGTCKDAESFANWNGLLALTTALAFARFSILAAFIAAKAILSG